MESQKHNIIIPIAKTEKLIKKARTYIKEAEQFSLDTYDESTFEGTANSIILDFINLFKTCGKIQK